MGHALWTGLHRAQEVCLHVSLPLSLADTEPLPLRAPPPLSARLPACLPGLPAVRVCVLVSERSSPAGDVTRVSTTRPQTAQTEILKDAAPNREVNLKNKGAWESLTAPTGETPRGDDKALPTPRTDSLWTEFQSREQQIKARVSCSLPRPFAPLSLSPFFFGVEWHWEPSAHLIAWNVGLGPFMVGWMGSRTHTHVTHPHFPLISPPPPPSLPFPLSYFCLPACPFTPHSLGKVQGGPGGADACGA